MQYICGDQQIKLFSKHLFSGFTSILFCLGILWAGAAQAVAPQIAAGDYHTVALKSDGTVVTWGSNGFGVGTIPAGLTGVTAIAAGANHTVALKSNGTVVAWGDNGFGQLSIAVGHRDIIAIAAGGSHSAALKSDGTVISTGVTNSKVPAGLTGVVAIAAGDSHTVALKSDGTVVAWGGDNRTGATTIPAGLTGVVAIAAGGLHTVVLKSDGTVVAWGSNTSGQSTVPAGLTGVTAIAAGRWHTVALKSDGTVVAWGWNNSGQTTIPAGLTGVTAIAAGVAYTVALKSDGTVVAWGRNSSGQTTIPAGLNLGAINTNVPPVPTAPVISTGFGKAGTSQIFANDPNAGDTFTYAVSTAATNGVAIVNAFGLVTYNPNAGYSGSDSFVVTVSDNGMPQKSGTVTINVSVAPVQTQPAAFTPQIAAGMFHTVALKSNGTVVAWGDNGFGQITIPVGLTNVTAIAVGWELTVALKSDGTVVAWGNNLNGQATVPAGLTGVTAIAAGGSHTVALKADGTVVAWGSNTSGESTVPAGLTGVIAIAAGSGALSVALKSDGTVVAWGNNLNGQATVPAGLTGVIAISAGFEYTVALKSNGTLVAWGVNSRGQTTIPVGLRGINAVAAGGQHIVALKVDGTVVAWGDNASGQSTIPAGLNLGVSNINVPPVPTAPAISTAFATAGTSQVAANDPNAGDTFTYSVSAASHGTGSVNGSGLVRYTANAGFSGVDSFVVTVTDNGTPKMSGTVTIRVTVAAPVVNNTLLGVSLGDVNGNGSGDFAVLGKRKNTGNYVVRVKDPNNTTHLISEIRLNPVYLPVKMVTLADVNGNGAADIAVLEVDPATGLNRQIQVKDGLTGAKIVNIQLNRSLKPVQMVVLPDANGNGSADLAVLEVDPATGLNRQIQVKDGRSGALIRNIPLKPTVKPHQMVSVGLINGVPALAVSEVDAVTGKNVQIQVKNARTGALISNIRVNPNYKPHMLIALPDVNGNGSPDLALSEVDAITGKNTQIQVKDAKTGGKISNVRVNTSVKPHMLVSVGNIGGVPAIALSEVNATTGKNVQIQVKNARTGALIRNIRVNSTTKPHGLIVLADINGNGSPELALSEVHASTGKNVQVQVKDAQTGARIRNIPMNPNYTPLGLGTGPDSNGNGVAEIGLLEVDGAGNVQVQIKDPLTGAKVINLPYPTF